MKIRIRGNSIRYRLDKRDIQLLEEKQQVTEETTIGTGVLRFIMQVQGNTPSILLEQSTVLLTLPYQQVKQWTTTEQVGFSLELSNVNLLIEKDFKCLTERNEDDSMAFDNPLTTC